jgi:hypothetical protein
MKRTCFSFLALLVSVVPASAITVKTPADGAEVTSPFNLVASTSRCESEQAASMGYSLDHGATTVVSTNFSAMVVAGDGQHILHVKCWGSHGAAGDTSLDITVNPDTASPPSNITAVTNIQSLSHWVWNHDPGTPGDSDGTSDLVAEPSLTGNARLMNLHFTDSGGEIYHISFGKDTAATHFIYEAYVSLGDASSLANIEMDMNQVIANGDTVIYGVQCDGYSGTWDYTVNLGTPAKPRIKWIHSNVSCPEPKTWARDTWHHIQISYSRDSVGKVTYESVVLDGNQSDFVGATGNSAFKLGWGTTLLTNFQLDGDGTDGSITAYLDKVTISRW